MPPPWAAAFFAISPKPLSEETPPNLAVLPLDPKSFSPLSPVDFRIGIWGKFIRFDGYFSGLISSGFSLFGLIKPGRMIEIPPIFICSASTGSTFMVPVTMGV